MAIPVAALIFEHGDLNGVSSPASDRRRQAPPRARRYMNFRQSLSEASRTQDYVGRNPLAESQTPWSRPNQRISVTDEAVARQIQLIRGTMSSKMVASREAIQALEMVEISSLPENEKSK